MMDEIKINLNDRIKVKLTQLGKEIYYHQYDGIKSIKPTFPTVDEGGYTEFLLWQFMQLYGQHIGMGFENVIDPLNIIVVKE